jgi:hypothetical protein
MIGATDGGGTSVRVRLPVTSAAQTVRDEHRS